MRKRSWERMICLAGVVAVALPALPGSPRAEAEAEGREITVQRGDTLSRLAAREYWRAIWEANRDKIANPDLIYPGQRLVIPPFQSGPAADPDTFRVIDVVDVLALEGEAWHIKPTGREALARAAQFLSFGSVAAVQNSLLRLRLADGTRMDLANSGRIEFVRDEFRISDESRARVLAHRGGDVWVYLDGGSAPVRVEGSNFVLDKRDGVLQVDAPAQGPVRVSAHRGNLGIKTKAGQASLQAGLGARIHDDGRVERVSLPAVPRPLTPRTVVGTRVEFTWDSVPDATGYVLTVARDPMMGDLLFTGAVQGQTHFEMQLHREGDYFWTIDSIDARGFRSWTERGARFSVDSTRTRN